MPTGFITDMAETVAAQAGRLGEGLLGNTIRLGVTGLRRSGKTVFVTSLVNNLLHPQRLPFLEAVRAGRLVAARLEPQPDLAVPRFGYEDRLADLRAEPPRWPEPTKAVSRVRLALRYRPSGLLRRRLAEMSTLTLDIVDYPGEWLLDLPLLGQDYATWSAATLELAAQPARAGLAAEWRNHLGLFDAAGPADEATARTLARLYTAYLVACRDSRAPLSLLQPGRFLEPGEMAGAPALAFCPMPVSGRTARGTLGRLMEDRFEAYKHAVVRRFFREHFAKLDRQVVLVDLLGALNAGAAGAHDLRAALTASLEAFRHGRPSRLERLFRSRIDKVLFAATKADHVAADQHKALRGLLGQLVDEARRSIRFDGAEVETMAIAAVKCTDTVTARHEGRDLACVRGIPLGRTEPTVLFPGELPDDLVKLDGPNPPPHRFLAFNPPHGLDGRGLPNIRMDQAIEFLLGDRLA